MVNVDSFLSLHFYIPRLGLGFSSARTAFRVISRRAASSLSQPSSRNQLKMVQSWDNVKGERQHQDSDTSNTAFKKLMNRNLFWDRDQLGDVFHWLRQAIAVICGIVWGLIHLTGVGWIIVFLTLSSAIIYGVYALYLRVNAEEFGGDGTLLLEGLFASVILFLLAWVLAYSLIHH